MKTATQAWLDGLRDLVLTGSVVSPRGQHTLELPQKTFTVDMLRPVLTVSERRLSYQFMAAEAYWILIGDDSVAGIAPYNKYISQFSDDGVRFFGAYGPKVVDQLPYVVKSLIDDHDTRQAGLTIWRENPPRTKDVPCTIALFFQLRGGELNCHAFMRSSDIWLGLPYDMFNFSMVACRVCELLRNTGGVEVQPGTLFITAASSHLYQRNFQAADHCLEAARNYDLWDNTSETLPVPAALYSSQAALMNTLYHLRESRPGDPFRWWEP